MIVPQKNINKTHLSANWNFLWKIVISMSMQRSKVIALYKHLQYLGREYPAGPEKFRNGCKKAFQKNSKETDPGEDNW